MSCLRRVCREKCCVGLRLTDQEREDWKERGDFKCMPKVSLRSFAVVLGVSCLGWQGPGGFVA
jgi:hypothetical protein